MDDSHRTGPARLVIDTPAWQAQLRDATMIVARAAEAALAGVPAAADGMAALTVLLTDDAAIRVLNRDWRGQDKPTNVLSFPGDPGMPLPPGVPRHLGDVAIALETLLAEASAQGRSPADHLAHLVVHGVLHLLGHDHRDDAEAEAMEALETAILARLGVADPYAAGAAR